MQQDRETCKQKLSSLEKILALDIALTNRLRMEVDNSPGWKLAAFLAHSGDSWFWLLGLGLVWLVSTQWRSLSAFLILDILLLAVLVMVIKFTFRRSRPPGEWGSIYRNTDPHSFPSGHAARAVMLAVITAALGPLWAAVGLSIWAILVSMSRIFTGMHYLSDVLAGMLLGLLSGVGFLWLRSSMEQYLPFLFF
ncbi:MAG: phosphatase PAP2 family protein [Bellilinea sp.]|jgi:undecaprenyl-diphosphatase